MTGVVSHWNFTTETWVLSQTIHVEFVADRLALSQVFLLLLRFFPCIIISLMLCTLFYLSVTDVTATVVHFSSLHVCAEHHYEYFSIHVWKCICKTPVD